MNYLHCLSSCVFVSHFGNLTSSITTMEDKTYVISVLQENLDVKMGQHISFKHRQQLWASNMSMEKINNYHKLQHGPWLNTLL